MNERGVFASLGGEAAVFIRTQSAFIRQQHCRLHYIVSSFLQYSEYENRLILLSSVCFLLYELCTYSPHKSAVKCVFIGSRYTIARAIWSESGSTTFEAMRK